MAKIEIFKTNHTGDLAEIERTATDADRYKQHREAPNINLPPSAKSPPTVPPAAARNGSAGLAVGPMSRRRPSLRTSLMAAGILVVVVGSVVFWLRGGRYASLMMSWSKETARGVGPGAVEANGRSAS